MNYPYKIKVYRVRKCNRCNKKLLVCKINFVKSKTCKWGYSTRCKECDKKYRKENKEKIKKYNECYYQENKKKIKEQNKKYREEHFDYYEEYNKQYREEHKEEIKEYQKQYYEENKEELLEKQKEYQKQYYEENKEKMNEQSRQYYEENKEERLEYQKQYYEEHKEEIKEYQKQYNINNPYISFNSHNKRRQLEENQGRGITKEQWYEMMCFFDWRCAYSGEKLNENRTIDHIIPLSKGGENEIWNCVPMFRNYNISKKDKDMIEWYQQQEFYSEKRLIKIYAWCEYALNKWEH